MEWHDIRDPNTPLLDELAARYHLHPLHIEDCRHRNQNAKVEENGGYIFVVLKPVEISEDGTFTFSDFDIFLGPDFLITVQEGQCTPVRNLIEQLKGHHDPLPLTKPGQRYDEVMYRLMDAVVDSYPPALDQVAEASEALEAEVLERPSPQALDQIFSAKRNLIELRRVLANTRDVAGHLQRTESELIGRDLWPFLRDVYDHVARNLDTVEVQRDVLSGLLDIYLSSVAQRTNQVVKVLTVLSTIALPAIVISSLFGMNLHGLPWSESPHGAWLAIGSMGASTVILLFVLLMFGWL